LHGFPCRETGTRLAGNNRATGARGDRDHARLGSSLDGRYGAAAARCHRTGETPLGGRSTNDERDRLRTALIQRGQGALLAELQKIKPRAGYIRSDFSVGWDIHFAREEQTPDGGRRIIVATDRPMSFWEAVNHPRSADYGFTLAEIRLGKDGKGAGKIVSPAKVTWNPERGAIEITNYGTEPVRLTQVTSE
jgi:hypothetical protein